MNTLDEAYRHDQAGEIDEALDVIMNDVDDWLLAGEFGKVDILLAAADPSRFSTCLSIGILTATLAARDLLRNRNYFVYRVALALKERGETDPNLLSGLR